MALSADAVSLRAAAPEYVSAMETHQRRNFALLVLDGSTFAFAISLVSETTVIPAFVHALADNSFLVGLVAACFAVGRYLPQLLGAHLVLGRSRRKPLLLGIVIAERVGILAIAVVAQLIGVLSTPVVINLFFLSFCGYAVTTGLIGPVYGDFVAKALIRGRGWFYGVVQLLGGVLGFMAALVGQHLLAEFGFPLGFQASFWLCFALSFLSIGFVVALREEPYPFIEPRPPLRETLAQIPRLIATDRPYLRFLTARALMASGMLGVGFVVVDGIGRGVLTAPDAALMAAVFILSQAVSGFVLGLVGNYIGWKAVVVAGGVLIVLGMAGALVADSRSLYVAVFVVLGGANAVTIIGDANMSIEMAPPTRTSLYLGTTASALAVFFIVGPLVAGLLVDSLSMSAVFLAGLVMALCGTGVAATVVEPRRRIEVTVLGQPGTEP